MITDYIAKLIALTKDVPPENIYNYYETRMSDDTGRRKIIYRSGRKYPERVINSFQVFCENKARSHTYPKKYTFGQRG